MQYHHSIVSPLEGKANKESFEKNEKGKWYTNKDCKHKNLGYLCLNAYKINLVVGC
jgi:hypothetical protein